MDSLRARAWYSFIHPLFEMDARFGSTSPYFRVFADGKSESRLDGIDRDDFQKTKLIRNAQFS